MDFQQAYQHTIAMVDRMYDPPGPLTSPSRPMSPGEELSFRIQSSQVVSAFLLTLSGEVIYRLTLMMYIGRGDLSPGSFPTATEQMRQTFPTVELAVGQMLSKGLALAAYLREGHRKVERSELRTALRRKIVPANRPATGPSQPREDG